LAERKIDREGDLQYLAYVTDTPGRWAGIRVMVFND
jgi:hypothetical protein